MSLKLGSSAQSQTTSLCGIHMVVKVWVKVKRMFPEGGIDPEPKSRS